jgi:hypothetical protein
MEKAALATTFSFQSSANAEDRGVSVYVSLLSSSSSSSLVQGRGRGKESRCCSPGHWVPVPTRGIGAVQVAGRSRR